MNPTPIELHQIRSAILSAKTTIPVQEAGGLSALETKVQLAWQGDNAKTCRSNYLASRSVEPKKKKQYRRRKATSSLDESATVSVEIYKNRDKVSENGAASNRHAAQWLNFFKKKQNNCI